MSKLIEKLQKHEQYVKKYFFIWGFCLGLPIEYIIALIVNISKFL